MISWNGETLPALSLEKELEVAALAGYSGVELFIPKLKSFLQEDHTVDDLARHLREMGLVPYTLNGIENINLQPPAAFAKVREECRQLSQLAQTINCPGIVVVPSSKPAKMTWPEVKQEAVSALRELADVAAPYGVTLGLEFLAPVNCSIRTLAQSWQVVQATERENVGIVFDTYHFYVGGSSWTSLETFDINRLLVVHVNDVEDVALEALTDAHRLLPGEGKLPLDRILRKLSARGYQGAYSLEVMRPAYRQRTPREYARAGIETTRRVLQQAGAI